MRSNSIFPGTLMLATLTAALLAGTPTAAQPETVLHRLAKNGTTGAQSSFNLLHTFKTWPLGLGPQSQLVADSLGNLYGTTNNGGASYCNFGQGCGTVFELIKGTNGSWKEKVIFSFPASGVDFSPGDLVIDSAGNLYGVTFTNGGAA